MFYNVWCNSSLIAKQWFDLLIFFFNFFFFDIAHFFSLSWEQTTFWTLCQSVCSDPWLHPITVCHPHLSCSLSHDVWVRSLIAIKYSSSPFMLVFACLLLVSSSWLRVSLNFAFTFQELHMVSTWMRVAANVPINLLIIFSINWLTVLGSSELHVICSS